MSRTSITVIAVTFGIALSGCAPTYEDYARENDVAFQGYMTGNVHTAKAALLQQEKIIAKHEAKGNRGVDYRATRLILYGHLCGISLHLGQTNEAQKYFVKYAKAKNDKTITFNELIAAAEKHDQMLKPKWKEKR